jgi:hypothetical protein
MALNFGILSQVPSFGQQFAAGQQAAQAQQERNMLRQAQMQQMAMQQENMLAQRDERRAMAADREEQTRARRATLEQQNALAEYVRSGMPQGVAGFSQFGEAGLKTAKALREAEAADLDKQLKTLDYVSRNLAAATPETYGAIRADISSISPQFGQALPAEFNPEQVAALAQRGMSLKDQIESKTRQTVVSPGATVLQGGKAIFTAPPAPEKPRQSKLLTPEEEAQELRLRVGSRPLPQLREPALRTTKVELVDGSIGVMNLDTGAITPATVGGQTAKGKPSAFAEKTAGQRKQLGLDLDRAITELTDATKKDGLIDQSTGSGAGRLVDVGAGFFGQATPGAIAAGKLAPIADMVLKMVPRFEGPQSDKDTRSYKEAAGQLADSSLPNAIRKQAGLEIVRLMKERKNQFVTPEMAVEGAGAGGAAPAAAPNIDALLNKYR